jgi:hypothetical protein
MAQGGDPTGTGYKFAHECGALALKHGRLGILSHSRAIFFSAFMAMATSLVMLPTRPTHLPSMHTAS